LSSPAVLRWETVEELEAALVQIERPREKGEQEKAISAAGGRRRPPACSIAGPCWLLCTPHRASAATWAWKAMLIASGAVLSEVYESAL